MLNSDSESAIVDCLSASSGYKVVSMPSLKTEVSVTRAQEQLAQLASSSNPLDAPVHLEYFALLALVVILYIDILDVAGIVSRL